MGGLFRCWTSAVVAALLSAASNSLAQAPREVEFNRDIRPILSDNCFQCHGPDSAQRKADLRLDVEASAKRDGKRDVEGVRPIVPGELDQSELYRRITSTASDERMPPIDSGKK